MKFEGQEKEYVDQIINHIESLGGNLIKECKGGSIYYSLGRIERIRISDHISLKSGINKLDIILKDNQFICIYYRDIKILSKVIEVKQWIEDMKFSIDLFSMYLEDNIDKEVTKLKKEINIKINKIEQLTKENKDLHRKVDENNKSLAKKDRQLEDKINKLIRANEWHNKYQESESENKKLQKQLKELYIWKSHFNDGWV